MLFVAPSHVAEAVRVSHGRLHGEAASLEVASMTTSSRRASSDASHHAVFLALLPKLQTHAQIQFRFVTCRDQRADKIAEVVALAWKWYVRLIEQGKDVKQFPMVFVYLVVKAVRSGRRVAGMEKAKDVMNARTQRRHGFAVKSLPLRTRPLRRSIHSGRGQRDFDAFDERLQDNTVTPPPIAAAFRIDFPEFLDQLTERDRAMATFLAQEHPAKMAAERFELTPGRVTQLRQRWRREWQAFQGEEAC
jgi:hypothetical protein